MTPTDREYRLLCLDGGGMMGLMTALWLEELERLVGRPLRDCFDLLAGTSTGAIIACGLAGGLSPSQLVEFYRTKGPRIFPQRTWLDSLLGLILPRYDGRGRLKELEKAFGGLRLRDLAPKVLVIAYDVDNRQPVVFKSWREVWEDYSVWRVLAATSAAPTYFPAVAMNLHSYAPNVQAGEKTLVDGGVCANNPTACGVAEALRFMREGRIAIDSRKDLLAASFGTGEVAARDLPDIGAWWGILQWGLSRSIINIFMDGGLDIMDYIGRQILADGDYFRLQAHDLPRDCAMDDASPENLERLEALARRHLADPVFQSRLQGLAERLR